VKKGTEFWYVSMEEIYHLTCLKTPSGGPVDEDKVDLMLAILQDMSTDLNDLKRRVHSIYEKEFPPIDKLMGGKHE